MLDSGPVSKPQNVHQIFVISQTFFPSFGVSNESLKETDERCARL